jgi:hypothetical protein
MLLPCGCEIKGEPVPAGKLKEHWEHTIAAMLFWESVIRPNPSCGNSDLAVKRSEYLRSLCKAFPQVFEGLST